MINIHYINYEIQRITNAIKKQTHDFLCAYYVTGMLSADKESRYDPSFSCMKENLASIFQVQTQGLEWVRDTPRDT